MLVSKIACGGWYSCAVSADGYLYTWGYGDGGWLCLDRPPDAVADDTCTVHPLLLGDDVPPGGATGSSSSSSSNSLVPPGRGGDGEGGT